MLFKKYVYVDGKEEGIEPPKEWKKQVHKSHAGPDTYNKKKKEKRKKKERKKEKSLYIYPVKYS